MGTIFTLLMILIMVASVLLVIIIMAQNPKGGGLSGTFGGTSSAQFGVQRTNDFMEKATWTLAGIITLLILLSVVLTGKPKQINNGPATKTQTQAPVNGAPQAPAAPAK